MRTYPEADRKVPVTIALPPDIIQRLDRHAHVTHTSRSEVVRGIIYAWIKQDDKRGGK